MELPEQEVGDGVNDADPGSGWWWCRGGATKKVEFTSRKKRTRGGEVDGRERRPLFIIVL